MDLMVAGGTSGVHLVEITDGEYATEKGSNILERVIENLGVQRLSKCSNQRCLELANQSPVQKKQGSPGLGATCGGS